MPRRPFRRPPTEWPRRWRRVRPMDHPADYARRIVSGIMRRRQAPVTAPGGARAAGHPVEFPDDHAARALRDVEDLAEFRWTLAGLPPRSATARKGSL